MTPLVLFKNADVQKGEIIKEIKGKAGIYRWTNNNNGKSYNIFFHFRSPVPVSIQPGFTIRRFSTTTPNMGMIKLDPWFVTGFCDGESHFSVSITSRAESKLKYRVSIKFKIELSTKEMPLLLKLKEFFGGVGLINTSSNRNMASYVVNKPSDILNFIIPHFIAYPLITQKRFYFMK